MTITHTQAIKMLSLISKVESDQLDCDGCFELLSEFAERELRGDEPSESLKLVEVHLTQCSCCRYEYEALLEAIRAADERV
jgi:predicted anti-sigma-YlaC factor YlaD